MKRTEPFAITISRQLGSGGAYVGWQLAKKLGVFYADREIISGAARRLSMLAEDLESREEKIQTFWQSFLQFSAFVPDVYMPPKIVAPTDRELFNAETEIIQRIATERSAVIIGRCGFHILREHPSHVSVFLHANNAFRNERVKKLYNVSEEVAEKMLVQSDKERDLYCSKFTGIEWAKARNYDISIDTSKIGVDKTVELLLSYLELV